TPAAVAAYLRAGIVPDAAAGGAPLLEEIDKLESVLERGTADNVVRARVTMRLQSLLAKWSDTEDPAEEDPADEAEQVQDASDEELFALINNGLGRY
ncbi:beta-ketoacyl synthase, partial [Streptomyces goshikiensis]